MAQAAQSNQEIKDVMAKVLGLGLGDLGQTPAAQSVFTQPPPQQLAGLGAGPQLFADGGLVSMASGGLTESSMNTLGKQAHFTGMNTKQAIPRGGNLAAINMRAAGTGAHLINSAVPGRTDRIPIRAQTGSFVIPADVVSGVGQGNTMAGAKLWGEALTRGIGGGGMGGMRPARAPGLASPQRARTMAGPIARVPAPPRSQLPPLRPVRSFAEGGDVGDDTTPTVMAGGELVVSPQVVTAIGDGDPEEGTRILCASVEGIRKQVMAYMKKLPGPAK